MITVYRKENVYAEDSTHNDAKETELRCNSTDEKPTSINNSAIVNGTSLLEIDTGKLYLYDADSSEWKEI